ncbi:MAG TPA: phosphatase PAP2 family protein [Abditibacteriaceae bacterium]|jgi:membrane-associated phospholipid phosphatase
MNEQIPFILALHNTTALQPLMRFFTFLGNEEFFLLLIPLVYLCIDRRIGARLGFIVLLCDSLAFMLKLFFHLPRPYWIDPRIQVAQGLRDTSYGLPSSHAQVSTAVWFFFAAHSKKAWMWIVAAIIVFFISLSRVYLGVHFPTDVIGGWIVGALFLVLFLRYETSLRRWFGSFSWLQQVAWSFMFSVLLFTLGFALRQLLSSTLDPAQWASMTQGESRSLAALASRTGGLFGLGAGLAMMHQWARFEAGGTLAQRVARLLISLVGLMTLRIGLSRVFPSEPEAADWFFRFVRYALMTWWVAFLAPLLFLKLRLVQTASADSAVERPSSGTVSTG